MVKIEQQTVSIPIDEQDARVELVQRIVMSRCLRSSNRLRDFLLYITDCAVRDAPQEATEQQIGMHVFGRLAGYNSSEDSIVRTHARLLRQKLIEYFADEGAREPLTVHIPKGHYLPVFQPRVAENPSLRDVLSTSDFSLTTGPGFSGILNQHPRAGEQTLYSEPLYSPAKDYAILAYVAGEQPGRHMLIFSGLTTFGT